MRHAEARDRLADLALEPARLAALDDDATPEARALQAHVADCQPCTADLAGWRLTWAQVEAAVSSDPARDDLKTGEATLMADTDEVLRAPASLRSNTLAMVAAEGRTGAAEGRTGTAHGTAAAGETIPPSGAAAAGSHPGSARRRWMPWMAAAAALLIALGVGSAAWTSTRDLNRAQAENAGLTATMASLDRVLATPAHWTATLRTPDGTAGGTVAWTASEIAVITSALPAPEGGQSYRCWVERDGVRTPIGPMWFSGSTGYWAGDMGGWGDLLAPGARFGVSVIPDDGGPASPVLIGTL